MTQAILPINRLACAPWIVYPTAFLEGISVIVIEIAGARALAPYFGTSLQVWTAQITVTLFFLAVGYGLGGLLARRVAATTLSMLFAAAGFWLALYPILRTPILDFSSARFGVAVGSLVAAAILFGVPLMMLGAVSPVLIAHIDRRRPGAGSAAGRLFFTNTMGGLAGGWLTAFAIIPHSSLRIALVTTGVVLLAMAALWVLLARSTIAGAVMMPMLLIGLYVMMFTTPQRTFRDKHGQFFELLYSRQSGIGLLQVMEFPGSRLLLINGVLQGQMSLQTNRSLSPYIHRMHVLALSHNPQCRSALQLGLGAGLLPTDLSDRGLSVTTIEIEPKIEELARTYFGLPQKVNVHIADARAFLRHDTGKYDLVLLDTFASETTPWHMLTVEAMKEMRARLNPGGRLLINTVSYADPKRPALEGIEATTVAAFGQAMVYPGEVESDDPDELANVIIVAGEDLHALPGAQLTALLDPASRDKLDDLLSRGRPARGDAARVCTDDRSDLDYTQAAMRINWRKAIWDSLSSNLLWD